MLIATRVLELGQEIACSICGKKFGIKEFVEHADECSQQKGSFDGRKLMSGSQTSRDENNRDRSRSG